MKKLLLLITGLLLLFSVEGQILRYSNYTAPTPPTVLVESISVWGTGGATTISTNGGTLQMLKKTLPTNAADTSATWSRTNGTGTANISAGGLLTALTNGTVTARATANDGSAVYGEEVITISNQSTNLVYNGTFDSADGWNVSGCSITGGQVTWTSANPYAYVLQFDTNSEGPMTPPATSTAYNITFTVVSFTGGAGARLQFSNSNNTVDYVAATDYSATTHTIGFTTSGTIDPGGLRISINNEAGCTAAVIDNVSIVLQ